MKRLTQWILRLFAWLLRLYPRPFRDEFGEEMTAVFLEVFSDVQQRRRLSLLIWCGREFTGLITAIMREQWLNLRQENAIMNQIIFVNPSHDADDAEAETPLAIIAGIFPFILFGLMFTLKGLDYHRPLFWMRHSMYGYLIVHALLLIGLGIGWAKDFPRWSYAYLGVSVMTSIWLAGVATVGLQLFGYTFGREAWGWRGWVPLLALMAVMLLITRSLQPLAGLFQGIRRDWTRLSFALYAALTWLFLGVAYDNKTWYIQTLYLPLNLFLLTLVITGGAFFYMRGRRQWRRTLALPAAFILHAPISALVTTLAGFSGPPPTAVGRLILPLVWLKWASVPLLPGLVSHTWQRFRHA